MRRFVWLLATTINAERNPQRKPVLFCYEGSNLQD